MPIKRNAIDLILSKFKIIAYLQININIVY